MLEDFDGVVAALEDATDTDSRHGQLGDVDVDVDVERINVVERMIVSKTSTSCVDRRNRPCVVFQCGCAADLLARIESGVGVCGYDGCDGVQRGFLVRLVEVLEARGWQVVGEAVRPRIKGGAMVGVDGLLGWGFRMKGVGVGAGSGAVEEVEEDQGDGPEVVVVARDGAGGGLAERHTVRYRV